MTRNVSVLIAVLAFLATVAAECPNACSAHGKCGAYDMCTCYRNWMSNDCSERICQFGMAHVDTPKGDLDASSGKLSGPDTVVARNSPMYPYGTTEQYPAVTDIDGNVLKNTAHEYRECSNKGICDRSSGTCACFEGYEGSACQRASCPTGANGVCSGHGTCQTIKEIAASDYNNVYKLWDEDITMGCVCDGGYEGADCSQRKCKYGFDPLYKDNNAAYRYTNVTYYFYLESSTNTISGNYSLVFHDSYGEDWETQPIAWNAPCSTVTAALEGLPNDVIPLNTVRCVQRSAFSINPINYHVKNGYTLAFPQNPGYLKPLQIKINLDGSRPTLYSDESTSTLGWHVYSDGYIGEDTDIVPDRCIGVEATLTYEGSSVAGVKLDISDASQVKLFKQCLGDSNGDSTDNVEVYNWDYGNIDDVGTTNVANQYLANPHLIKLQDTTEYQDVTVADSQGTDDVDPTKKVIPKSYLCDTSSSSSGKTYGKDGNDQCANHHAPPFYAVLFFDGTTFRILTHPSIMAIYSTTTKFAVYTTTGYLQLVSANAHAFTARTSYPTSKQVQNYYTNVIKTSNVTNSASYLGYNGDVSCENNGNTANGALDCVEKGDLVMLIRGQVSGNTLSKNTFFPNIYRVQKVGIENRRETYSSPEERQEIVLDYAVNNQFVFDNTANFGAQIYKFYPPTNGYNYAAPCSNRGICNQSNGVCECFHGYGEADCSCINALAV